MLPHRIKNCLWKQEYITICHLSSSIPWLGSPSPNTKEKTYESTQSHYQSVVATEEETWTLFQVQVSSYRFNEIHSLSLIFTSSSPSVIIWIPVPYIKKHYNITRSLLKSRWNLKPRRSNYQNRSTGLK